MKNSPGIFDNSEEYLKAIGLPDEIAQMIVEQRSWGKCESESSFMLRSQLRVFQKCICLLFHESKLKFTSFKINNGPWKELYITVNARRDIRRM